MPAAHNTNNYKICHFKAQSLELHFTQITQLIIDNELHVLALGETWLKPHYPSNVFTIPGYNFERADRLGMRSGEVALYICESISYKVLSFSPQVDNYVFRPQFLFVFLQFGTVKILLGVIYSPSRTGYWHEIEEAILNCNTPYDYALLDGDFNIN